MFCLSHFQFLWNYIKLVKVIFELASFDFILLYFIWVYSSIGFTGLCVNLFTNLPAQVTNLLEDWLHMAHLLLRKGSPRDRVRDRIFFLPFRKFWVLVSLVPGFGIFVIGEMVSLVTTLIVTVLLIRKGIQCKNLASNHLWIVAGVFKNGSHHYARTGWMVRWHRGKQSYSNCYSKSLHY